MDLLQQYIKYWPGYDNILDMFCWQKKLGIFFKLHTLMVCIKVGLRKNGTTYIHQMFGKSRSACDLMVVDAFLTNFGCISIFFFLSNNIIIIIEMSQLTNK